MSFNQPWRPLKFMGRDLQGNKYYEGPPIRAGTALPRRTIEYKNKRLEYSDYDSSTIPVQWMSWLRHTRDNPPSIEELQAAESQKARTLELARQLDLKWEQSIQARRDKEAQLIGSSNSIENSSTAATSSTTRPQVQSTSQEQIIANPGEAYQPQAWDPAARPPRRE
ncbi:hypothetical protein HDU76_006147 [Blyttiomyces sp. JEL0837]|nr:hypothetical protein HDU76_006147 [Blyttiomyces sp. JEL0837]